MIKAKKHFGMRKQSDVNDLRTQMMGLSNQARKWGYATYGDKWGAEKEFRAKMKDIGRYRAFCPSTHAEFEERAKTEDGELTNDPQLGCAEVAQMIKRKRKYYSKSFSAPVKLCAAPQFSALPTTLCSTRRCRQVCDINCGHRLYMCLQLVFSLS